MDENQNQDSDSLEGPSTDATGASTSPLAPDATPVPVKVPKLTIGQRIHGMIIGLNIYMLLFVLIVVLAGGIVFVSYQRAKKQAAPITISTQTLDTSTLQQINGTDSKVGDAKQTLTVESNAVFSGKVLVRDSLDIAGGLKVGGTTSLAGVNVSGVSGFDQLNVSKLAVTGDQTIQGGLAIQKTLNVAGSATFGGAITAPQITVQNLNLAGDLQFSRHIDAGGGTPGQVTGTALGSGGTASVSGTDTAGTISINTGGNTAAGCFLTVNFTQKFNATPHVVMTPVGSDAGAIQYYVTRTAASFSACTASAAPTGASFAFDYIVID